MKKILRFGLAQFTGAALLLLAPGLCNAQVYKCVENGSTTFQAEPCKTGGTLMHLDAGPSAQAVDEANERAEKAKLSAKESTKEWRSQKSREATVKAPDCAKLNQAVANGQAKDKQITREAIFGGDQRIINQMGAANQKQLGYATQMAQVSGCQ